jgi:nucleoside-diphosphate-sugar epimerase
MELSHLMCVDSIMTIAKLKPVVAITGAAGDIGSSLTILLGRKYTVVGLDRYEHADSHSSVSMDLTDEQSVKDAIDALRRTHGDHLAAVVHLAGTSTSRAKSTRCIKR